VGGFGLWMSHSDGWRVDGRELGDDWARYRGVGGLLGGI
jgi:hypothetical protein